jgi:hypothetical protein
MTVSGAPSKKAHQARYLRNVLFGAFSFRQNVQNPVALEESHFLDATKID